MHSCPVCFHLYAHLHTQTYRHTYGINAHLCPDMKKQHGWCVPRGFLPADSQGKAHLMPSHLPSVCWIIPFACYTTGTSMNTPVKYKHTQQNAQIHRCPLQIAGRNTVCASLGVWYYFACSALPRNTRRIQYRWQRADRKIRCIKSNISPPIWM